MTEEFYQEIKKNIDTNLLFSDIEIIDYKKEGDIEYLKLELPFTTTGNILTYKYNSQTDKLELLKATIFAMKENAMSEKAYIDRNTIMKIYNYCRNRITTEETNKNENIDIVTRRIEEIYEIIIKGLPLTDETLGFYNFTKEEIDLLINKDIIKIVEPQRYALTSIDNLHYYGIKLLLTHHAKTANECFKRCYQLEPTNRDICIQMFTSALKTGNYNEAFKMFSEIEKINLEEFTKDNNLYLYLLKQITKCKEEYQDRANNITEEDILLPNENNNPEIEYENIIRSLIIKEKYKRALSMLNDKLAKESIYVTKNILLKELISQALNRQSKFNQKLFQAAKEKRYSSIVYYLESKAKVKELNNTEIKVYLIAKAIIDIKQTKKIPSITKKDTTSLYEAIAANDFAKAKRININFLNRINGNFETDIIYLLLEDINKLLKELRDEHTKKALQDLLFQSLLNSNIKDNSYTTEETNLEQNIEEEYSEEDQEVDLELDKEKELAYSIKETDIPLNIALKSSGLFKEQLQLIKLVYVRDYYIEGTKESYELGDKLLQEVDSSILKTEKVERIISKLRKNRNNYKNIQKAHTRTRHNNI